MSKRGRKKESHSKRVPLPPIQEPEVHGLNLHPKRILYHPLLPIIIGITSSAWSSNMILTLWIILVCSAWLCFDIFPWAKWVGIRISNRNSSFVRQLGQSGKEEAIANRNQLKQGWVAIIAVFFFSLVLLVMAKADRYVINSVLQSYKEDTFQQLHGSLSFPTGGDRNNTRFTIENDSSHDITLIDFECHINHVIAAGGRIERVSEALPSGVLVHHGGDKSNSICPGNNHLIELHDVICGDITWAIVYALREDPKALQRKQYRFSLARGESEWSGIALDGVYPPCQ